MIRLYTRVSTEEQGDSGLGLEAQDRALLERYGGDPIVRYTDIGSAKNMERPELCRLMAEIRSGDTLAVAKLDRLSRRVSDFALLLEQAEEEDWTPVALDLPVDMSTTNGKMLALIQMTISQWERETIGDRTRDALAVKKANGQTLGRQVSVNSEVELQITALAAKMGPTMIAKRLNELGVPTARGGQCWYPSTVRAILERLEN